MTRNTISLLLPAHLLAACGEPVDLDGAGAGEEISGPHDDELDGLGPDGDAGPGALADDLTAPPTRDPKGWVTNPGPDQGPGGRITWIGDVGGDLVVHATISDEVLAHYEGADHYRLRFEQDTETLTIVVVSTEDTVLDVIRNRGKADGVYLENQVVVQSCFPDDILPPIVICGTYWCPIDGDWPFPGNPWPSCTEIGEGTDPLTAAQVVGSVQGLLFGKRVTVEGEVETLFEATPTEAQATRFAQVQRVHADIALLRPEVETTGLCFDCELFADWIISKSMDCGDGDLDACVEAGHGVKIYDANCGDVCD
jgi:hypothetical protein